MRLTILTASLALATALTGTTAMAEKYLRDSDGEVISIIRPIDGRPVYILPYLRGGEIYYAEVDVPVDFDNGVAVPTSVGGVPVNSQSGGVILEFGADTNTGALPASVEVAGATFDVEQTGNRVFLRDTVTGERFAAKQGSSLPEGVNPKRFGLD